MTPELDFCIKLIVFIFQILTCICVPLGWFIVHKAAKSRQTYADIAKFARETVADVDEIEQMALEYHSAKTRNNAAEDAILRKLDKLELRIERINTHIKIKKKIDVVPFRQSITIKNFLTSRFKRQDKHSKITQQITQAANQLIQDLYLF